MSASRIACVSAALFAHSRRSLRPTLAALACAALLAACGAKNEAGAPPAASGGAAPPPPQVGVVTVQPGTIGLVNELPGRLEASRLAQSGLQ